MDRREFFSHVGGNIANSLDGRLYEQPITKQAYSRRSFLTASAALALAACSSPTSPGTNPPPPPPVGDPTLSIGAAPMQATGMLESRLTGQASAFSGHTIDWVWNDLNNNNQQDAGEVINGGASLVSIDKMLSFPENTTESPKTYTVTSTARQNDGREAKRTFNFTVNPYNIASGTIKDILTGAPIPNATVSAGGATATTDSSGNYTLKATQSIDQIAISAPNFQTYTTYSKYSTEQGKQSYGLISTLADPLIPGNSILQSVNKAARTLNAFNPIDFPIRKWDENIKPRYMINTTGLTPQMIALIEEVYRNDVELLSDEHVKNAATIEYVTSNPSDLRGIILFHYSLNEGTGVTDAIVEDYKLRGGRVPLVNSGSRAVISHEIARFMGHQGDYASNIQSIISVNLPVSSPAAIDLRNSKVIWNRPYGSVQPDTDPR
ncbi:MAG TPA: carboxypeptidase regulatory-like domain-containing protein [Candidatus Nanoarchaeia archaeon]|nr:carboxypeptidase regulatory-like domain-containing protein [Candidatus Nanoarchaeia archaeon]